MSSDKEKRGSVAESGGNWLDRFSGTPVGQRSGAGGPLGFQETVGVGASGLWLVVLASAVVVGAVQMRLTSVALL